MGSCFGGFDVLFWFVAPPSRFDALLLKKTLKELIRESEYEEVLHAR